MKGGLLPLLVIVAVPAFVVGTLVGAGPAAVIGTFVALFGLITSAGGPLWPDLRRLAALAPVLLGAAVVPRLLADVSRPAAFAVIVVLVVVAALLPLLGSRFTTTGLGLGMVTLLAYGIPLTGAAGTGQLVVAAAAGVVVALLVRLLLGIADPSKATRAAVAGVLDAEAPDLPGAVSLWLADGRQRWLGTVLQAAGRYRLALRSAEALGRRSGSADGVPDELRTRAGEVAERVRAKRPEPAPGIVGKDLPDGVRAAGDALDDADRAAAERDGEPVAIPEEARRDLRVVPTTGWLRTAQVRHAVRTGVGILLALLISVRLRPGDPLLPTLLMTTFGVLQASWRDTLAKAGPRIVGLVAGSVVVVAVVLVVPTAAYAPIAGVALVVGMSTITTRPALGSAAMVCMSVAMNSSLRHLEPVATLIEYVVLTAAALVLAVVVGFVAVPGVRRPPLAARVDAAVAATVASVRALAAPDRGGVSAAQQAVRTAVEDLVPDRDRLSDDRLAALDRFREGLVDLRTLAAVRVLGEDSPDDVERALGVLTGDVSVGPDDGVLVVLAGELRADRAVLVDVEGQPAAR